jgi:hypothetical protein
MPYSFGPYPNKCKRREQITNSSLDYLLDNFFHKKQIQMFEYIFIFSSEVLQYHNYGLPERDAV